MQPPSPSARTAAARREPRSGCRPRRCTRRPPPPRSSSRRSSATTASRSWSGPTRSARTRTRCSGCRSTIEVPILAIHAPCLIITQRVWTTDPWIEAAEGAVRRRAARRADRRRPPAVPVAARLRAQLPPGHRPAWRTRPTSGSRWRTCSRCGCAAARCRPTSRPGTSRRRRALPRLHAGPVPLGRVAVGHAGDAGRDGRAAAPPAHRATAPAWHADEHLIPGRGTQPCAEVLERSPRAGFDGHVIVEVNTRRALDRAEREADLAEALAFCRLHLAAHPACRLSRRLTTAGG